MVQASGGASFLFDPLQSSRFVLEVFGEDLMATSRPMPGSRARTPRPSPRRRFWRRFRRRRCFPSICPASRSTSISFCRPELSSLVSCTRHRNGNRMKIGQGKINGYFPARGADGPRRQSITGRAGACRQRGRAGRTQRAVMPMSTPRSRASAPQGPGKLLTASRISVSHRRWERSSGWCDGFVP